MLMGHPFSSYRTRLTSIRNPWRTPATLPDLAVSMLPPRWGGPADKTSSTRPPRAWLRRPFPDPIPFQCNEDSFAPILYRWKPGNFPRETGAAHVESEFAIDVRYGGLKTREPELNHDLSKAVYENDAIDTRLLFDFHFRLDRGRWVGLRRRALSIAVAHRSPRLADSHADH